MSSPAPYSADFAPEETTVSDRRKIDPQNIEAEKSVLAACMLNPYGARLLMVPFATMSANSLKSVGIGELAPWTEAAPAQAAVA